MQTRADGFEELPLFMQSGLGQHRVHDASAEQAASQGGSSNEPGLLRSYEAPYTEYRELAQQIGPPRHHVPTGVSLTSNDAGMFSNVDLILQAASERLTDPGSGGKRILEQNPAGTS